MRRPGPWDDPEMMAEQLSKARELVDLTLQEARAAISGLRPPVLDDLGLSGGLASLARSIPEIDMEVDLDDTRLPDHIELALYRIAQECLQNVVKHANAKRARLTFFVNSDTARLEIIDDGVGFDTFEHPLGGDEMGGYGLLSMAERAEIVGGRLNIRSRPGVGHRGDGDDPAAFPHARRRKSPLTSRVGVLSRLARAKKSPELRRSVSMESASARDSSSDMPISANTSLLRVTVASSTVERPRSVICTSVVRPSVGCGIRSTSPSASSRRIACVTLVTCTCSRSDALVIGSAPVRLNASSRSNS